MRVVINPSHPEPRKLRFAAEKLCAGSVIAYPTDTVYGLGCAIGHKRALDKVYRLKALPRDKALSLVCADLSVAARYVQIDNRAYRLMKQLLPGPYTLILNATRDVPRTLMMRRRTVGIRVPDSPVVAGLVAALGGPIISTSATYGGDVLTDPSEIAARFSGLDLVLDADLGGGTPSTIVDLCGDDPVVLRQGAGPADRLAFDAGASACEPGMSEPEAAPVSSP
ncbi:MAG: threonylcarbamoyl-AMP synthase [Proteobacteria bacterium]|nr:threonylcarbamoyl-AMP synthase [Pseudomonadota bacterium]